MISTCGTLLTLSNLWHSQPTAWQNFVISHMEDRPIAMPPGEWLNQILEPWHAHVQGNHVQFSSKEYLVYWMLAHE
jgi:hypothetical protein